MKTLSMEEIRSVELGCLKELKRVCEEHALRFILAYGTLIGAMRHEGFIPWDDDIDVQMPRDDYELLYELYLQGAFAPHYQLVSYRDGSSIYPFFKLVDSRTLAHESFLDEEFASGLWVDIFPLETVDMAAPHTHKLRKRAYRLVWARHLAATDPRFATSTAARCVKRAIYPFTRRIDRIALARRSDELAKGANVDRRGEVVQELRYALVVDDQMERHLYEEADLFPAALASFEGEHFPVPAKASKVLSSYYGDWQRIPAPDERPPAHLREVEWICPESERPS